MEAPYRLRQGGFVEEYILPSRFGLLGECRTLHQRGLAAASEFYAFYLQFWRILRHRSSAFSIIYE